MILHLPAARIHATPLGTPRATRYTANPQFRMTDTRICIDACNKLLRGEISAVETYSQALAKFGNSPDKSKLRQIMGNHQKSADVLRNHISEMGAVPDSNSGPWATFAKTVEGAAALLGKSPAVSALIEGEEHGIHEYEEALKNPHVMTRIKVVFRDTLIPRLQKHIAILERLPASAIPFAMAHPDGEIALS